MPHSHDEILALKEPYTNVAITFDNRYCKMRVPMTTLKQMGSPRYIRQLYSQPEKRLILQSVTPAEVKEIALKTIRMPISGVFHRMTSSEDPKEPIQLVFWNNLWGEADESKASDDPDAARQKPVTNGTRIEITPTPTCDLDDPDTLLFSDTNTRWQIIMKDFPVPSGIFRIPATVYGNNRAYEITSKRFFLWLRSFTYWEPFAVYKIKGKCSMSTGDAEFCLDRYDIMVGGKTLKIIK